MPQRPPHILLGCCTRLDAELAILVSSADGTLPARPTSGRGLDHDAAQLSADLLGRAPSWMTQVAAVDEGGDLVILFAAVVPAGAPAPQGYEWQPLGSRPGPWARRVLAALRDRLHAEPIAFHLLPERFTLSELQEMYSLLMERKLHKASFRRTLMAAHVVAPTDEWRSEGRGRPAQLFRYAPRGRRGNAHRAVRFEFRG